MDPEQEDDDIADLIAGCPVIGDPLVAGVTVLCEVGLATILSFLLLRAFGWI